ncbi:MAG: hypothetical protein B7Y80_04650 [Hyphomicrobium sp. 32-62-53]|nr:MAG: hypothetical protein B7Z29_05620 [Hyphomicrobium sp. 12-62-95]OYY01192.1 MAG: hypothetical protein B7Y80_04650 [Hyphomicrobium sp. 32-62-53]
MSGESTEDRSAIAAADSDPFKQDWPTSAKFGVSAAHLHALGAISLSYNRLEACLGILFADLLRVDRELGDSFNHRMTTDNRLDALTTLVNQKLKGDHAECTLYALKCFKICSQNRNTLAHIVEYYLPKATGELLIGSKKNSQKTRDMFFALSVVQLRQVADDILRTYDLLMALGLYRFREWHEKYYPPGTPMNALDAAIEKAGPNRLPDRPPLPQVLKDIPI